MLRLRLRLASVSRPGTRGTRGGVLNGGGLGQLLFYHLGLFHFAESGTVIIAMLVLVGLVDWASTALRERLTR